MLRAARVARAEVPGGHTAAPLLLLPLKHVSTLLQAAPAAEEAAGGKSWWKFGAATLAAGTAGLAAAASISLADEAEHGLHAPAYPWPHDGFFRCDQALLRALAVASVPASGGCFELCRRHVLPKPTSA